MLNTIRSVSYEASIMRRRRSDNWFDQIFDTPEKKAKFHKYLTYGMILSWVMIVIGVILFILIITGILHA